MICCPCAPTLVVAPQLPGPGEPGGTLPPGDTAGQFLQWNGVLWVPSSWTLPEASPLVVGDVLTVTAPGVAEFQAPAAQIDRIHYAFGNNAINTGTQFVSPWLSNTSTDGAEIRIETILFDGTLSNFRVLHANPTGADNLVYTVRVGATVATLADTALAVTLNSGASAGSNLVASVAVTAGQLISLKVTGATVSRTVRMAGNLVLEVA
jgi:hypothetical protein